MFKHLLNHKNPHPQLSYGRAFAPSNMALCKYWGKRDTHLNLPTTGSLSISLGNLGTHTTVSVTNSAADEVYLNDVFLSKTTSFYQRIYQFFEEIRYATHSSLKFKVQTRSLVPVAAGVASSACGFAALVKAIDALFEWNLSHIDLSIMARLCSGSACRSLWNGFVEWRRGEKEDGSDSYGSPLSLSWPSFRIGLCHISKKEKTVSSRAAMEISKNTSPLYCQWESRSEKDLKNIKNAIETQDFETLGYIAENNAQFMHDIMHTSHPAIHYDVELTQICKNAVCDLRYQGIPVFWTQDAGANLALLFLSENSEKISKVLSPIVSFEIINPWLNAKNNLL
jgi:diphosphomevalonate decarboxylase